MFKVDQNSLAWLGWFCRDWLDAGETVNPSASMATTLDDPNTPDQTYQLSLSTNSSAFTDQAGYVHPAGTILWVQVAVETTPNLWEEGLAVRVLVRAVTTGGRSDDRTIWVRMSTNKLEPVIQPQYTSQRPAWVKLADWLHDGETVAALAWTGGPGFLVSPGVAYVNTGDLVEPDGTVHPAGTVIVVPGITIVNIGIVTPGIYPATFRVTTSMGRIQKFTLQVKIVEL